jgi:hypothetical protein
MTEYRGGAGIGNHPLEDSCQEAIPPPCTTFDNFFSVALSLGKLTPDLGSQTHPCFLLRGVGPVGAAPNTHQDQGCLTARLPASRPPLAPVVPQKTVGSLPCPIVDRSQMPWLPYGSRLPMAHGRGVARLTHPVGGPLAWVEVGTNQTVWFLTIFPTRLQPQPNRWLDLSQRLCGHQRARGLA